MKRTPARQAKRPGFSRRQRQGDHPKLPESKDEKWSLGDPDPKDRVISKPSLDDMTRSWMAKALMICSAIGLGVASAIGAYCKDWSAINAVWCVVGPFVGALVMYYFRVGKAD
jgi:hypothetical protein